MAKIQKKFQIFLLINFIVWSVVPLLRKSLSMDTYEAIVWGKFSLLGTTKHPPFSGIIAYGFYKLSGEHDFVMYGLSQIFVLLGIIYIFRLARLFLPTAKAVLATMLQFGIIYYNYSSVEFNVNVISLALWPAAAYYFWRAYQNNRTADWLLFGLMSGLNLLNKYVGSLELAAIFVFIIYDKKFKDIITNYRAYLAGFVGCCVIAPHVWWLFENNFTMLNYIAERSSSQTPSFSNHFLYPLKFAGAQLLFGAAALISYLWFYRRLPHEQDSISTSSKKFLLCQYVIPPFIFITLSLITGSALKSMWGFPLQYLTGIILVVLLPAKFDDTSLNKLFNIMVMWSMLFAGIYALQCVLTKSLRYRTNGAEFTAVMEQKWQEQNPDKPLIYVGGDVWYANLMSIYGSAEIKPMIWLSPKNNPWFDAADFNNAGALIVAANEGEYNKYKADFPNKVSAPQVYEFITENFFGRQKKNIMYYGFYKGDNSDYVK